MKSTLLALVAATALMTAACGRESDSSDAPPRTTGGDGDNHALVAGTYRVLDVFDLNDGCGVDPLQPGNSLEDRSFSLTNDGNGRIGLSMCSYGGTALTGDVLKNEGNLSVRQASFQQNAGDLVAEADRECRFTFDVTADNQMEGTFTVAQSNRNKAMKDLTDRNVDSCSTTFKIKLQKQ